jgi:2-polyprenyl-3-methyl-5-hydroxy-6-metoxy-1,4-benzoquinol methylase
MSLQEILLPLVPGFVRFYRTRLTLDFNAVLSSLPETGTLLDVGCGIGNVLWEVGRKRPELQILGIDLDPRLIQLAERFHSLPNVSYRCLPLENMDSRFDCVSFVDVFHHVPDHEKSALLSSAQRRLKARGYIFIKDVTSSAEGPAYWMDRYLSGCRNLWFSFPEGWARFLPESLQIWQSFRGYRFPFGHYYLLLGNPKV